MPERGLEPPWVIPPDPEPGVSTNFTTRAGFDYYILYTHYQDQVCMVIFYMFKIQIKLQEKVLCEELLTHIGIFL